MRKYKNVIKKLILIMGDFIALWGMLFFTLLIRYYHQADWNFYQLFKLHILPFSFIFTAWLILFGSFGLYELKFMKNSKHFLYRLLHAMAANTVLAIVILYLFPFEIEPRRNLFIITAISTAFIFLWRYIFNIIIIRKPSSRILFFGINPEVISLVNDWLLLHPQFGHKPVGFISNGEAVTASLPLPHFPLEENNISQIVQKTATDTIIISREIKENKKLAKILFQVIPLGVGVVEFSAFHEMLTGKIPSSLIQEMWFLENLVGIKKSSYEFFKRGLDMLIAVFLGIPSAFILPLVALAIKLDSSGPIFYTQKRVGRHGKEFSLIKYRSMMVDADKMRGLKGQSFDPRHTRVGLFLRKRYLDELPQIFNVLRGDMSFVGPRPERPAYVADLKQKIPFYETRFLVQPGLTGWAQVNMENDASVEDAPEKMQYDLYYIKNRSFVLDLLIILRTISALIRRKGR